MNYKNLRVVVSSIMGCLKHLGNEAFTTVHTTLLRTINTDSRQQQILEEPWSNIMEECVCAMVVLVAAGCDD